jgi:hypothetical protein
MRVMNSRRIGFEQLSQVSGLTEPALVQIWLQREGVAYALDADAQPWTTLPAIARAMRRRAEQGRSPRADAALDS